MGLLKTVTTQATKFSAKSSGIIGTVASGAGTDLIFRAGDTILLGGKLQSIASVAVPIINITVGFIDALNYLVHAKGKMISKDGAIAVIGAKVLQGAVATIPNITLPSQLTLTSRGVEF